MPRLLLINGLPGSGKSTLARRYVDDLPLSLALDIDIVLGLLGAGSLDQHDAWPAARRLALAMARLHLEHGHDVVIPQFLGAVEDVLELEALSVGARAAFTEVVLSSPSPIEASRRFQARAARAETPHHRDAPLGLPHRGSVAEFAEMDAALMAVVRARPSTTCIEPVLGDIDLTYATLLAAFARTDHVTPG